MVGRSLPTETERITAGNTESYKDSLSARLRSEADLHELAGDLVAAVWETMQPEHILLWLRPAVQPNQQRAAGRIR